MVSERDVLAGGCLLAGALAGAIAEYAVRRRGIVAARWIGIAGFGAAGAYGAALVLQAGHVSPATHRAFVGWLIGLATVTASRLSGVAASRYGRRASGSVVASSVFVSVIEAFVVVVGALMLLGFLGISVAPILTAFGIGGLAVALALQNTLTDFFAGVQIAASGQIHPGDFVKVEGGRAGTVVDINWRNTVLEDGDANRIVVPNQKLAASVFTNLHRPLRVDVPVSVERGADLRGIADLARDAAGAVPKRSSRGDVDVRFEHATSDTLDLVVRIPAESVADTDRVRSEFTRAFLERVAGKPAIREVDRGPA